MSCLIHYDVQSVINVHVERPHPPAHPSSAVRRPFSSFTRRPLLTLSVLVRFHGCIPVNTKHLYNNVGPTSKTSGRFCINVMQMFCVYCDVYINNCSVDQENFCITSFYISFPLALLSRFHQHLSHDRGGSKGEVWGPTPPRGVYAYPPRGI